ncbi:hypothetical protein EZV62_000718 [Acer yangbiense]|uniref:CCHC-type domain-containing protein n=1 Tax=Acer yangbiense TaxID=1000413 RepID=A0A5C7ISQ0_9ROSI|nr:hypothetical protein EZV62_000718 [Acer yangbiense]
MIVEEDNAVLEATEEVQHDGVGDMDRSLVGKVLSGKRVNRDAFKSLIDQLWNPFGKVEIELISDNTFMFYFVNREERNRRSAKWLAEQIGVVVELLSDSRECWDNLLINSLKLGKTEDIVVVGLKYERLPDFCFVCGRIGHVVNECTDELARLGALDGSTTRFGQWLKAPVPDKFQSKFSGQASGSSSERDRVKDKEPNSSEGGSLNLQSRSLASQNRESTNAALIVREVTAEVRLETLPPTRAMGPPQPDRMAIDGPISGPGPSAMALRQTVSESSGGWVSGSMGPKLKEASPRIDVSVPKVEVQMLDAIEEPQKKKLEQVTPIKKTGKKWKRAARGVDQL